MKPKDNLLFDVRQDVVTFLRVVIEKEPDGVVAFVGH